MIKYTPSNQLALSGFEHPFEQALSPDNRWVKLSRLIPWDDLALIYAKKLNTGRGRESLDIRMVIAALIVKHKLGLDDRGTVTMISENIYLQYFCGLKSFQTKEPFHPTVFVEIRKRMGGLEFDKWNALIIERADGLRPKGKQVISQQPDQEPPNEVINKGTLKIDATVANQKIAYPTDAGLLNRCREESERLIDLFYKQTDSKKKPRDYRRMARKEYLTFSKKKKKSKKQVRKFIGKQLRYLKRNLGHIEVLLNQVAALKATAELPGMLPGLKDAFPDKFPASQRDQRIYWVIQHIYQQQEHMYENNTHSHDHRIVNIHQPYVRPIPRGKQKAKTEFGAKISASEVEGMSRVEHISWDNFNESTDLELQCEIFKNTYGHYPELLLADQIYLNRKNRKWLKNKGIRIVGKPLGRPKEQPLSAYQKRKRKKEQNQRNLIEGKFGQGKNAYGLNNIQAKRSDTSESWIACIFFVMNLIKLEKIAKQYAIFWALFQKTVLKTLTMGKNHLKPVHGNLKPNFSCCAC